MKPETLSRIGLIALSLVSATWSAGAASCPEPKHCQFPKLVPSGGSGGEAFGFATASTDQYLLIGAPNRESVSVFRKAAGLWAADPEISLGGPNLGNDFGDAIAAEGEVAIVGAPLDDTAASNAGAVYEFTRVGGVWVLSATIMASNAAAGDRFGGAVALSGDTLLIGAEGKAAAYVFKRDSTGWQQRQQLTGTVGGFGAAVDTDGERLLIGAWGDDQPATNAGSAFVYRLGLFGFFVLQKKLSAADFSPTEPATNDYFGSAVAIQGNFILIGAYGRDDVATNAGAVYAYRLDMQLAPDPPVWVLKSKVLACDPQANANFGRSVDIDDENNYRAVVGAPYYDGPGASSGAAYVLGPKLQVQGTWEVKDRLTACDAAAGDYFGWDVAISGDYPLVGAYGDDIGGTTSGSAYVFSLASAPPDCFCRTPGPGFEWTYGNGKPGTNGVPVLEGGKPPIIGEVSGIRLNDALPGALLWLAIGVTDAAYPFDGGTLLVGAPQILMLGLVPPAGFLEFESLVPASPQLSGATVYHQLWFQDPGAAGVYHTAQTNGLARTFGS